MTPKIALKYWRPITEIIIDKFSNYELNIQCRGLCIENEPVGDSVWFSNKISDGKYRLVIREYGGVPCTVVATWEMYQMRNCRGICISTAATVTEKFRNIGLGKILNLLRIDLAKTARYNLLLCTDCLNNEPQQKILDANGWQCINEFKDPRTGNKLGIHTFDLTTVSKL